jgi:CHASE3 domain sensor protein
MYDNISEYIETYEQAKRDKKQKKKGLEKFMGDEDE